MNPIDLSNVIGTKLGNTTFIHTEQHSVHKQTTDISDPVHQYKGTAKIQHTVFSQNQQQFYGEQEEFYQKKSKLPFPFQTAMSIWSCDSVDSNGNNWSISQGKVIKF